KKFGKLSLKESLAPAIRYAEEGYPLTPILGKYWKLAYKRFKSSFTTEEFNAWFETFAPDGRAPEIGEVWKSPDHAETLRSIAETNADSFYKGEIADKIDDFMVKHGGYLRKSD
ncbi:gamma-glutamyltransferase, partial [Microvirga sp. 3-52]|nr:gamma-glutamyltransferase [Microvirga sp. 3-52]